MKSIMEEEHTDNKISTPEQQESYYKKVSFI